MTETSAAGPLRRRLLYGAVAILFLLHHDLWLWHDARLVLGLPAGLAYHLGYCAAAALLMAALVRWAWPGDRPRRSSAASGGEVDRRHGGRGLKRPGSAPAGAGGGRRP